MPAKTRCSQQSLVSRTWLQPPSEVTTTESGSRNGRSTADSSYASAVGSPIGDYEAMDAEDGNENGGWEGWAFSPVIAAASSPSV